MNNQVIYLIILFFVAFLLSISVIPQILKIVLGKKIFDAPGGRKIHKNKTPSMGGIGVFFSFILVAMFTIHESDSFMAQYYYFSMILLFFTGLRDDLFPVRSLHKFLLQVLAALVIAGFCEIRVSSLYSLDFLYANQWPEWLSFAFTIFFIVAMTNAYNLIDGIDGLAGSIAVLLLATLTVWFGVNHFWQYAFLCGIMTGSIAGFIYYNWHPAKIFMGDTGSLIIGFFCSSMLIVFLNLNQQATVYTIDSSVAFIAVLFVYPIYDIMRVSYLRLKKKKSPFSPDKLHIHLLLRRIGIEHNQITTIIFCFSLGIIILFFILNSLRCNELFIFVIIILYCVSLNYLLHNRINKFTKNKQPLKLKRNSNK